jgi:hypothetical protein
LGESPQPDRATTEALVIPKPATSVRSAVRSSTPSTIALCGSLCVSLLPATAHAQAAPASSTTATAAAPTIDASQVPSYMDVVERGLRLRFDLGGRLAAAGLPDPPVRLEVDDVVQDRNDLDVQGVVMLGYDRAFGAPLQADLLADFNLDGNPDSPVSPFLDDQSAGPRLRLYSAFIGLSPSPGEPGLAPYRVNLGRMTEIVDSPVTYDGASVAAHYRFGRTDRLNAKLWGGLDAPQRLANDPFSRTSNRAYAETYELDPNFVSNPGGFEVQRTAIADPILNFVGGLGVDGRFSGVGFVLQHSLMSAQTDWGNDTFLPLQRTTIGASYQLDTDWLTSSFGVDAKLTDFVPRNVALRGDALTADGTTRVGLVTRWQFLEDITAYDGTFRAANPAATFDLGAANALEKLRVRDQIRHLNFGPPQEHIYVSADVERQLPASFQVLLRGRLRQHFDAADVDLFRTNFYEAGAGLSWNPGLAFDVGTELTLGLVDSGQQNDLAYDLNAEGVASYVEPRAWVRSSLLEGRLRNLTEVFVRRTDIQTKALLANGQWSGALATTVSYDVTDFWAVSVRVDGDALSPIDSLNASTYFGALAATSVRF